MSNLILPPSAQRHQATRDRELRKAQVDEFVQVAKSFAGGSGAPSAMGVRGVTPGSPMKTSWTSNLGNAALLQRAAQTYGQQHNLPVAELEQALADQGLSWEQPFAPGRPLDPFLPYRSPARTRNYQVGENVQIVPRADEGRISFETLRALYEAWDVPMLCVQHLINDVRSLDSSWLPADGVKTDVSADIEAAEAFFLEPDGRRPFEAWLAMYLQDVFRWDAGALYVRCNRAGDPISLETVQGITIKVLSDYYGRVPMDESDADTDPGDELDGAVVPAYLQVIQGMPFDWLTAQDLIYQPLNPVPESNYGLAPLEKILLTGNTDVRFQLHFLEFFTEGTLPAGLMEAPPDMSDPAQLVEFQAVWDALMAGDQAMLRKIRWVPAGAKFTATKNSDFDEKFPLYLMRRCCAAYGVTPSDIGFTDQVNKACYSEDTEVLTEHGFKRYGEVGRTERIATLNPDTGGLEYHVPDGLHVYPYNGEMVRFESNVMDILVTPDHKMWTRGRSDERYHGVVMSGVKKSRHAHRGRRSASALCRDLGISRTTLQMAERGDRLREETARKIAAALPGASWAPDGPAWPRWRKAEAHELEGQRFWLTDRAQYTGGAEVESFTLPAVAAQSFRKPERTIPMDLWLEFLGYVISEGCIFKPKHGEKVYLLNVSQSLRANPDKAAKIEACLDRLPIKFRAHVDADGACRWQANDKALWTWLAEHIGHKSGVKHLPDCVRGLPDRQLRILFEALMLGDGSTDPRPNATGRCYYTKSRRLADEMQELAWKLGYRAQVGRGAGVWRVSMAAGEDYQLAPRNVTRVAYKGVVWCFHVRNHLFVTRRNGKITIQGNTGDTQIDVQFRVGTRPALRHVEAILSLFAQRRLKLRVKLQIDDGREVEDRVATAQAHSIYIQAGVESPDEVRDEIGKPTDKTQAVSRFIQTRQGITMLEALLGQTKNPIDPETFAPAGKVEYIEPPEPIAPPAKPPAPGEPGPPAAAGASEQAQASDATPAGEKPAVPGGQDAANTNTSPVAKAETAGITAATGIAGVDMLGHSTEDEDEDEDDLDEIRKALIDVSLRRWKANARNRLRKGQAPRRFVDPSLPAAIADQIWSALQHAGTRDEVDAAFAALPKARARKAGKASLADFHKQADQVAGHYAPLIAQALAGLWGDDTIRKAWDAAQSAVKEAVPKPPPPEPPAEPPAIGAPALRVLQGGKGDTDALLELLRELTGDAALQGAHEAAHAAGGTIVASLQGVTDQLPAAYWDAWEPGYGAAAAKDADGGLKALLDQADITLQGLTDSAVERIGNALAEGLARGDSFQAAAQAVQEVVASPARAALIANTEYGRASVAAAMDTYREAGVEQKDWLAEDDACERCQANADASPLGIDEDWPSGEYPCHPGDRCAVAPHV